MKKATPLILLLALTLATFMAPRSAQAVSTTVVISQVYGGGGNTGAPYLNDFVVLYNRSTSPVSLTGWALQYASATGTAWSSNKLNLTGTIPAHGYFLVQYASGGAVGAALPTADQSTTATNLSATAGKLALTNTTTALAAVNCPTGGAIVDFVGFGTTADCREGSANAPAPSNTTAISRVCGFTDHNKDTDQNGSDFAVNAPSPVNSTMGDVACSPTPTNSSTWGDVKVLYR